MVGLLQLGALGLALCGVSSAVALPQTDATAASTAAKPACKGMTKRQEWYVSPLPLPLRCPRRCQANLCANGRRNMKRSDQTAYMNAVRCVMTSPAKLSKLKA